MGILLGDQAIMCNKSIYHHYVVGTLYALQAGILVYYSKRLRKVNFQCVANSPLGPEGRKGEKTANMLKTQKEFWLMKVYLC